MPQYDEGEPVDDCESVWLSLGNGWEVSLAFFVERGWRLRYRSQMELRELDPFEDLPEESKHFGSPEEWPLANLLRFAKK